MPCAGLEGIFEKGHARGDSLLPVFVPNIPLLWVYHAGALGRKEDFPLEAPTISVNILGGIAFDF